MTPLQSLLQRQISAGAVPAADQSALSSAVTDIGSAIQSGATSSGSMKDRVDGLIDNEVSGGKLTSDQATELKGLFQKASTHVHAPHAHGGGGSSVLSDLLGTDDSATTTDALGVTTATRSATDPLTSLAGGASSAVDGLASFVSSLRTAVSSNSLYGAGSTAGRIGSVLVNSFA